MRSTTIVIRGVSLVVGAVGLVLAATPARAAVPGITGPTFNLVAGADYISQPDGATIYSFGYGCDGAPSAFVPFSGNCPRMQLPGPTLIVTEGDTVTVRLRNNLPIAAGNTSIVFPGFQVTTGSTGVSGLLTREAANGDTVTYTFTAARPGTYAYHSGTQANCRSRWASTARIVVRPASPPAACKPKGQFSLSSAAYGHPSTCSIASTYSR